MSKTEHPPEIKLSAALDMAGSGLLRLSGRIAEQRVHRDDISPWLWQDIVETAQRLLADLGRFQAARPEFRLTPPCTAEPPPQPQAAQP